MFQDGSLIQSSNSSVSLAEMYFILALSPELAPYNKSFVVCLSQYFVSFDFLVTLKGVINSYSTEINPSLLLTVLSVPWLSFSFN